MLCPSEKFGLNAIARSAALRDSSLRASPGKGHRQRPQRVRITLVELDRLSRRLLGLFKSLGRVVAPFIRIGVSQCCSKERECGSKTGVECGCAPKQPLGLAIGLIRELPPELAPAQEPVVGLLIVGALGDDALAVASAEIERERRDDVRRHVVLDGEDVGELPVEPLRPKVAAGGCVDELGGDPDPAAGLAHAPFEHMAHAEALADLADVDVLALERESRIAGDDEELRELRQRGDDVLGNAVGEIFLFGIPAHVGEGQHGDRRMGGLDRRGRGGQRRAPRPLRGAFYANRRAPAGRYSSASSRPDRRNAL